MVSILRRPRRFGFLVSCLVSFASCLLPPASYSPYPALCLLTLGSARGIPTGCLDRQELESPIQEYPW